jgi:hypothetical protein
MNIISEVDPQALDFWKYYFQDKRVVTEQRLATAFFLYFKGFNFKYIAIIVTHIIACQEDALPSSIDDPGAQAIYRNIPDTKLDDEVVEGFENRRVTFQQFTFFVLRFQPFHLSLQRAERLLVNDARIGKRVADWFYGAMSSTKCESYTLDHPGVFVVRYSSRHPGQLVLQYSRAPVPPATKVQLRKRLIYNDPKGYTFRDNIMKTSSKFVENEKKNSEIVKADFKKALDDNSCLDQESSLRTFFNDACFEQNLVPLIFSYLGESQMVHFASVHLLVDAFKMFDTGLKPAMHPWFRHYNIHSDLKEVPSEEDIRAVLGDLPPPLSDQIRHDGSQPVGYLPILNSAD